jgi:hypothetical protein
MSGHKAARIRRTPLSILAANAAAMPAAACRPLQRALVLD